MIDIREYSEEGSVDESEWKHDNGVGPAYPGLGWTVGRWSWDYEDSLVGRADVDNGRPFAERGQRRWGWRVRGGLVELVVGCRLKIP